MKSNKKIYSLFILIILQFCVVFEVSSQNIIRKYNKKELISEIDFLIVKLESIHPDLYFFTPKDTISKYVEKLKTSIDTPLTKLEFFKKLCPIVTLFKDGHTFLVSPTEEWDAFNKLGGKLFPYSVSINNNKEVFVKKIYNDDKILIGSKIISINNIPMTSIVNQMLDFESGYKLSARIGWVESSFKHNLWLLDFRSEYKIKYIQKLTKDTCVIITKGVTKEKIINKIKSEKKDEKLYKFYAIDDSIAVADLDDFGYDEYDKFSNFFDSTFRVIKNQDMKYLIIDIRDNGGGSVLLTDKLLSYFNKKPYNYSSSITIKSSKEASKRNRQIYFNKLYLKILFPICLFFKSDRAQFINKHGITTFEIEPELHSINDSLFFSGKVFLLINCNTFSTASQFANAFKCYKMGTVIGEETGGPTIQFGERRVFTLPITKIKYGVSTNKFIYPCARGCGKGVLPDYYIKDNKFTKPDEVINFTKNLIEKK